VVTGRLSGVTEPTPLHRPGRHGADDLGSMVADLDGTADRERIARDLHYRVVARLDAIRLLVEHAGLETDPAVAAELLAEATRTIDQTKDDVREAVFEWRQAETSSLVVEMREVVEDYASLMKFAPVVELVGPVSQIPDVIADNIVPVLREALSNIARHAAADAGQIELRVTDDEVRLTVEDDGVGLSTRTSENGLRHARRRAETLGGSLDVHQRQPRGTTFVWRVPLG
jgi:signal transduction histidine kinase